MDDPIYDHHQSHSYPFFIDSTFADFSDSQNTEQGEHIPWNDFGSLTYASPTVLFLSLLATGIL